MFELQTCAVSTFYWFNCNVLIRIIFADSHVNITSGRLWQLLVEPWRVVEGAACVQRPTTSTIPQRVVTIEYPTHSTSTASCVTEVVIPYKCWRLSYLACGVSTGTTTSRKSIDFIMCCDECPDVLSWVSMCETYTIHANTTPTFKCIRTPILVGLDFSTHFGILQCGSGESDREVSRRRGSTCPVSALLETMGTLMTAVCHVQFSNSPPPSSDSTTRPGRESSTGGKMDAMESPECYSKHVSVLIN